jgi:hypothetical protein
VRAVVICLSTCAPPTELNAVPRERACIINSVVSASAKLTLRFPRVVVAERDVNYFQNQQTLELQLEAAF